jgi:hypothetical protein
MEKRSLNRDNIDHMEANKGRSKAVGQVKGVVLRNPRMLGRVDADQDLFEHWPGPLDGDTIKARGAQEATGELTR